MLSNVTGGARSRQVDRRGGGGAVRRLATAAWSFRVWLREASKHSFNIWPECLQVVRRMLGELHIDVDEQRLYLRLAQGLSLMP